MEIVWKVFLLRLQNDTLNAMSKRNHIGIQEGQDTRDMKSTNDVKRALNIDKRVLRSSYEKYCPITYSNRKSQPIFGGLRTMLFFGKKQVDFITGPAKLSISSSSSIRYLTSTWDNMGPDYCRLCKDEKELLCKYHMLSNNVGYMTGWR